MICLIGLEKTGQNFSEIVYFCTFNFSETEGTKNVVFEMAAMPIPILYGDCFNEDGLA